MNLKELDSEYIAHTYKRFPIEIVRGKGSLVYDETGKEFIDMGAGIGVTSFGVADEKWQQAIIDQIGKVQHMSNLYYTEPCVLLAEKLCNRTGMKKVFFSNSGAESNECAIKVARKYAQTVKGPEYQTIITLKNSFHGRTITTLAATGQDHYHEEFLPLTGGFVYADAGDLEQIKALSEEYKVAGILMECIQGEGGVINLDPEFVQGVAAFARERDILVMIDEVQTGNGRTGQLYAYMNYGIMPDIVSTAKGLAGGLPLGATLLGEKVENVLNYGDHGSTYGGNPVSCAAALSIIERIDDTLLQEVRDKAAYIRKELEGLEGVLEVSGIGLMVGIKTVNPVGEVLGRLMEKGVLALTAHDKLRLLPALNIPMDVLERAVGIIKECL